MITEYIELPIASLQNMIDALMSPMPEVIDPTKFKAELALESILFLAKEVKSLREEINKLKSEKEPTK